MRKQQVPFPVTPILDRNVGHEIEMTRQAIPGSDMVVSRLPRRRMSCKQQICCYFCVFVFSSVAVTLLMTYINTGGLNVFGIPEEKPLPECPNKDGTEVIESYEQPCLCGKETCGKKEKEKRAKLTRCYASVSLCTKSYYGHSCENRREKTDCMCDGKLCINGGYCNNGTCV